MTSSQTSVGAVEVNDSSVSSETPGKASSTDSTTTKRFGLKLDVVADESGSDVGRKMAFYKKYRLQQLQQPQQKDASVSEGTRVEVSKPQPSESEDGAPSSSESTDSAKAVTLKKRKWYQKSGKKYGFGRRKRSYKVIQRMRFFSRKKKEAWRKKNYWRKRRYAIYMRRKKFLSTLEVKPLNLTYRFWVKEFAEEVYTGEDPYVADENEVLPRTFALHPKAVSLDSEESYLMVFLAVCEDNNRLFIVDPSMLDKFILTYATTHNFVVHNVSFVFKLIDQHLQRSGSQEARDAWWEIVNSNRMSDIGIMDSLLKLAEEDAAPPLSTPSTSNLRKKSLDKIIQRTIWYPPYNNVQASCITFDSSGGAIGGNQNSPLSAASMEDIHKHALAEAVMVHKAHRIQRKRAIRKMRPFSKLLLPNAIELFGPLTESIQVKATIALDQISSAGMLIDKEQLLRVANNLEAHKNEALNKLPQGKFRAFFSLKNTSRKEVMNRRRILSQLLQDSIDEIEELTGMRPYYPISEDGKVSLLHQAWRPLMELHPFIKAWVEHEYAKFMAQFVVDLPHKDGRVHPQYTVMVRNGRTSCTDPSIQRIPRNGGFRQCFVAPPGCVLLRCDYNWLELCTLAAVCEQMYGFSVLGDVIRSGVDPHAYTAAMLEGVDLDEFMSWKDDENPEYRHKFRSLRHRAKAINFGIAGGQGAAALREAAFENFGVTLTARDARKFKKKLITHVYPELGCYLYENVMANLARNLHRTPRYLWRRFMNVMKRGRNNPEIGGDIKNVLTGIRKDGMPYSKHVVDFTWGMLKYVNRNRKLAPMLEDATLDRSPGNEELYLELFGRPVATLTGRVRSKVKFTVGRNTPFSGLAADGAKLALWNLAMVGYKVIAFVHDEVLIELDENADLEAEKNMVEHILCESMRVVTPSIPISCTSSISKSWGI